MITDFIPNDRDPRRADCERAGTKYREIAKELHYAAEYGCDSDLLERAGDALQEAADEIELSATAKSGTTVYMRMLALTSEEERRIAEGIMNRSSPDRIVILPSHIEILNPEELQTIKTKILGE